MSTLTLGPRLFGDAGTLFDEPAVDRFPPAQPLTTPEPGAGPQGGPSRAAGGSTLEDVILATWQQLASGAVACCPVCRGELHPAEPDGPRAAGGRCQDCGSRLS